MFELIGIGGKGDRCDVLRLAMMNWVGLELSREQMFSLNILHPMFCTGELFQPTFFEAAAKAQQELYVTDRSGHRSEPRKLMCEPASARPTGTELLSDANRSGHIARTGECCAEESASVIESMAINLRFPGHSCHRQNPVDLPRPSADISMSHLPQDEPS